jgi:hypothetical protein
VPWLVIKIAIAARAPTQVIEASARGASITMQGIVTHRNAYVWDAKTVHKNPDGSAYPATISEKPGGFDLVMSAAGKGVLTNSYRGVEGNAAKLTIVIVMRDEKTGAELVRLNRYLDRV